MEKLEIYHGSGALETFSAETTRQGTVNGIPYIDKLARIFKAGTHRGKVYTKADMGRLASSMAVPTADDDWSVPVQLDHDMSADKTRGSVRSLFAKGAELWGWLRFTGRETVDKVLSGQYRKLSAGIYYGLMKLGEVSVTPDPHFDDTTLFHNQSEEDIMSQKTTDKTEGADKNPPSQEAALAALGISAEEFARLKAGEGKKTEEKPALSQDDALKALGLDKDAFARLDALRESNKTLAAEVADLKRKDAEKDQVLATFQKKVRTTELHGKVDKFRASGHTTALMYDKECELVETFTDEQVAKWEAFKATTPALVDPNTITETVHKRPGDDQTQEQFKANVKSLVDEYGPDLGQKKEA